MNTNEFSNYVKNHVYRVLAIRPGNKTPAGSGSGFFISRDMFFTCFHVVFGSDLSVIIHSKKFIELSGNTTHEKLALYFEKQNIKLEIELDNGNRIEAQLENFDEKYDLAVLKINKIKKGIRPCKLNLHPKFFYGKEVAFGGFSDQYGYKHYEFPFAYNEGIVSSFVKTVVGAGEYEHVRINSINLNGNSGAPLFEKGKKEVIGIINGNMNWGRDDLLARPDPNKDPVKVSNRVPLNITYATSTETIAATGLLQIK